MTYDAFLSYSSQDKTIADAMCHHLEQRGLRCWIAPRDVRPGEDYAAEIIDGIKNSRTLVIIFSANANASKHVKNEVERAVSHGTIVVPFRTEAVQPSKAMELFLGAKHWLDAISPPLETHFEKLAKQLTYLADRENAPTAADAVAPPRSLPTIGNGPEFGAKSSRRPVVIPALSLVGVSLLAGIGLVVWHAISGNGGGVPAQAPAAASAPAPAAAAAPVAASTATAAEADLHGVVDVLLWNGKDPSRHGISIRDASARPIRTSDTIRVNVSLNRPAYPYLVWIGGDGKASPVYPWRPGDWRNRPEREKPVDRLSLPEAAGQGWPMGGNAGMETILLLARETPLPREVDLENAMGGLTPQKFQNPDSLVQFDGGRPVTEVADHSRAPLFFDAQQIDDPLLQNQQLIKERLERHFPLITAISFANRGE